MSDTLYTIGFTRKGAKDSPAQCHRRLVGEWLQRRHPGLQLVHLR